MFLDDFGWWILIEWTDYRQMASTSILHSPNSQVCIYWIWTIYNHDTINHCKIWSFYIIGHRVVWIYYNDKFKHYTTWPSESAGHREI